MAKQLTRTYPPEFRRKIIELVRSGRSVAAVSREFDVSRQTVINWLRQDDADSGRRDDVLNSDERKELAQLRRENKRLKLEQEILSKAALESIGQRNVLDDRNGVANWRSLEDRGLARSSDQNCGRDGSMASQ